MVNIVGNPNPKVGDKTQYSIISTVGTLVIYNTEYEWYLFKKQKNGEWLNITTATPKKGKQVDYTFGEVCLNTEIKIKVYEIKRSLIQNNKIKNKVGEYFLVPRGNKEPQITKVVLFNRGAKDINKAHYTDTLVAQAHCIGLFRQEIEFSLWEDDAPGKGHNPTINKNNKAPRTYKARVNAKGIAEVKISLLTDEKVLRQIANRYTIQGDKDEGANHEYYVTASYVNKIGGASQVNVNVSNPDYKKGGNPPKASATTQPKKQAIPPQKPAERPPRPTPPAKPQPKPNSTKFPATPASRIPKKADPQGRIDVAYFSNVKGERIKQVSIGESFYVRISTKNMLGKYLRFIIWEYDNDTLDSHDEIYKSSNIKVENNYIVVGSYTVTKEMFAKGRGVKHVDLDSYNQNYFIEVIPLEINAYSKRFGVDSDGLMKVKSGKSASQVKKSNVSNSKNCGGKYCIKKGDKSELIREINIRLAGFGGNVPTDEFTDRTEKMIKQFQRDYMKVTETGKICGNVLKAIDDFQNKYPINFDEFKCKCKKCKGFGNNKYTEQKQNSKINEAHRKYEYAGIHRSLIWMLRSAVFYTTVIEKDLRYSVKCISSAYRCWEDNKQHKRSSTNHMGKALDVHFNKNGKRTQVVKEVEEIRQKIFVKHLGNQVRWITSNKFSLEPGIPAYKGEFIAGTWIHYDVRQFELKYLEDRFFAKSIEEVNGKNIVDLAGKTHVNTCSCLGGGIGTVSNTPATVAKNQSNNSTEEDGKKALKKIYHKHGKDMAIIIERMYRDETSHFKSGQYKACGTGGMEAFGNAPYYGWDKTFFETYPQHKPLGIWSAYENKGKSDLGGNKQVTDRKKEFVVLPSVLAGMEYKAFYIKKYNGNWARWHSTEASSQRAYKTYIESIKPRFVNEFEKK